MEEPHPHSGPEVPGAGLWGASLSAQYVLRKLGAGEVVVISRTGENNYDNLDRHQDAAVIVNATPVGMYPNTAASPVDLRQFPHCEGVLDLIYNPARTALLQQAETLGIPHLGAVHAGRAGPVRRPALHRGGDPRHPHPGGLPHPARQGWRTGSWWACPAAASPPWAGPWPPSWTAPSWTPTRSWRRSCTCPWGVHHPLWGGGLPQGGDRPSGPAGEILGPGDCHRRRLRHPAGELSPTSTKTAPFSSWSGPCPSCRRRAPPLLRGSLEDMYTIRLPMYRRFADITVANDGPAEKVAQKLEGSL